MRKRLLIACLSALSILAQVMSAQTGAAQGRTGGFCNGRFWNVLDEQTKIAWIEAYSNGVTYALLSTTIARSATPADSAAVSARIESIFPRLTWGEVRKALDHFYDAPENGPIPVPEAIRVLSMRVAGIPQVEIDKRVTYMRQVAIKTLLQESGER